MATVRSARAETEVLRLQGNVADPVELDGFSVRPSRGGVEIEGLDVEDAKVALKLLGSARKVQYDLGVTSAAQLIGIMSSAGVVLTPPAPVEQATPIGGPSAQAAVDAHVHDEHIGRTAAQEECVSDSHLGLP